MRHSKRTQQMSVAISGGGGSHVHAHLARHYGELQAGHSNESKLHSAGSAKATRERQGLVHCLRLLGQCHTRQCKGGLFCYGQLGSRVVYGGEQSRQVQGSAVGGGLGACEAALAFWALQWYYGHSQAVEVCMA